MAVAYIANAIPHADTESLQAIRQSLDIDDRRQHYTSLIRAIEIRLEATHNSDAMNVDETVVHVPSWRSTVRDIVQAIIQPEELPWMEDDLARDDTQFISRALQEVQRRFEVK